jgi:hypothetical protein
MNIWTAIDVYLPKQAHGEAFQTKSKKNIFLITKRSVKLIYVRILTAVVKL